MIRNQRGFTLAEMLTAMVVMAIISLATLSLTMALTTAQEYSEDFHRNVQIARNSLRRIERDINRAKLITAGNSDVMVYWLEDSNDNGDIELRELRMIARDPSTGKVWLHYAEFPDFWPQVWKDQWDNDMTVQIATRLNDAATWIKNVQWAKADELASEVSSMSFSALSAPPMCELVQIEVTVGEGPGMVKLRTTASMRAHKISDLYMDSGVYYLTPPE